MLGVLIFFDFFFSLLSLFNIELYSKNINELLKSFQNSFIQLFFRNYSVEAYTDRAFFIQTIETFGDG